MLSTEEIKHKVGEEAAQLVKEDMVIGIGSGSTVFYFIESLAKRVKSGLNITGVPTSLYTLSLAEKGGINMTQLNDVPSIDLTIDGADEIDNSLQLIKGGGAALLQEKMVAASSKEVVIIADSRKLKDQLGAFPLPVEVVPYGWKQVQKKLRSLYHIEIELRIQNGEPLITDHGHYILDCHFGRITDAAFLNSSLHLIPGVVETGLFINLCNKALVGQPDGSIRQIRKPGL